MSNNESPPFGPTDAIDDEASSPYDSSPQRQEGDQEVLERQRVARRMTTIFAYSMGAVTLVFFFLATCFAIKFTFNYYEHFHNALNLSNPNKTGIVALIIPIIPATFFSILGIVTLITTSRFVSSFANDSQPPSDGSIIQDTIREVISALKSIKGGE